MLRRFASALITAAAVVTAVGVASPAQATVASDMANAGSFVAQINAERAKAGRSPLVPRADLASVALGHSRLMSTRNNLHHNGALTTTVANWRVVGENVGMGGNARVVHTAFMKSPAHRANVLDRDYTEVGIGVTVDNRGVMWVTEVFRQPLRTSAQPAARTTVRRSAVRWNVPATGRSAGPAGSTVRARTLAAAAR